MDELDRIRQRARQKCASGHPGDAVRVLGAAVELHPRLWPLWHDLGLALAADGRPADAVRAYERAAALGGCGQGALFVNLGNALRSAGRKAEAVDVYRSAIAREPTLAPAFYNLHAALYDDAEPAAAEAALERALVLRSGHADTRFYLGALRTLHGGAGAALLEVLPSACGFLVESLRFVEAARTARTRLFADTFDTLAFALDSAPTRGLVVELGVRRGTTLQFLAVRNPSATVHGLDSFEGLPERWGSAPPGLYTTFGAEPELPDNVRLHRGWFCDTVGPMLAAAAGPLRFVNVDCDLYASTAEALEPLACRMVPGTVLVFDEYLCNPGWREEEHRAWLEIAQHHRLGYEYLAFSLFTKQAVVRVTSVG